MRKERKKEREEKKIAIRTKAFGVKREDKERAVRRKGGWGKERAIRRKAFGEREERRQLKL